MRNRHMGMKNQCRRALPFLLLGALGIFFCWLFVGRHGIFGSNVDWISQHSVIPEYFRKQFYETGDLFPEFAANIGGGQNIYNFAYYGLFNPVILISYLLPFVSMGDYLMGASVVSLVASVELFYGWLRKRGFSESISFMAALMYLLSGPMIFHSYCQLMFVNYMPFLCLAFFGVDHYFEEEGKCVAFLKMPSSDLPPNESEGALHRKKGGNLLYTFSVFLMILSSFYFSIGGMLVLVLYGLSRYAEQQKNIVCDIKLPGRGKETKKLPGTKNIAWNLKNGGINGKMKKSSRRTIPLAGFLCDGIRFLWPMLTAVLLSGILLVPTAAALAGREGARASVSLSSLWIPDLQVGRLLYTPYGIGLPTLMVTVLVAGFAYKELPDRVLSWGCTAVLAVPFFSWVLNGGLYIRAKALIPCLPLLCYLIACYLKKLEEGRISLATGVIPYVITMGLLYAGRGNAEMSKYTGLFLFDGAAMAACFLLYRRRKRLMLLMVPPVVFLILFGSVFHGRAGRIESREFYEKVNDPAVGQAIGDILARDRGFYRLELAGSDTENAAELNRIRNMGQYISSVYSSSYNREYQEFRKNIFELEEPFRNDLMQPVSKNPLFQQLMGVRYLISEKEVPGYGRIGSVGSRGIYKNEWAAPAAYVTDRMLTEQAYGGLEFPYNQMALAYAAVRPGGAGNQGEVQEKMDRQILEEVRQALEPVKFALPEQKQDSLDIAGMRDGYRIRAKKKSTVQINLLGGRDGNSAEADRILFCRFRVKNCYHPSQDVAVWLEGERNKLTARDHFYYNGNTVFSYAVVLEKGKTSVELSLGKGEYEITEITCCLGDWNDKANKERCGRLYRSEFRPDRDRTKGNVIAGSVDAERDGYFVTSIPYDPNFEVLVDGKAVEHEKVNCAFLGLPIPEGSHAVELVYHAPGRTVGAVCSAVGAVLIFLSYIHIYRLKTEVYNRGRKK